MRDFSCFGESGVQIADSSSNPAKTTQNLVTCLYQAWLRDRSCIITVTWSKTMMGQGLSISIEDSAKQSLCKLDIKPWIFSKRKGSKNLEIDKRKLEISWDLSAAKFGIGPEPLEGFHVAIVFDLETVLLLGDSKKSLSLSNPYPQSSAVLMAKKEHIYGKKIYNAKAQFRDNGKSHDIAIECDTAGARDPCLEIRVDKKRVVQIKRLGWKFRGNQTVVIDGIPVQVLWDVYNWLFGENGNGNAVFMFQAGDTNEKSINGFGFSLILYAWKIE